MRFPVPTPPLRRGGAFVSPNQRRKFARDGTQWRSFRHISRSRRINIRDTACTRVRDGDNRLNSCDNGASAINGSLNKFTQMLRRRTACPDVARPNKFYENFASQIMTSKGIVADMKSSARP